jgi:hypothetical protein
MGFSSQKFLHLFHANFLRRSFKKVFISPGKIVSDFFSSSLQLYSFFITQILESLKTKKNEILRKSSRFHQNMKMAKRTRPQSPTLYSEYTTPNYGWYLQQVS